jgi:hypothetical protein
MKTKIKFTCGHDTIVGMPYYDDQDFVDRTIDWSERRMCHHCTANKIHELTADLSLLADMYSQGH